MAELPLLRRAVGDVPTGAVARRMVSAVRPHGARFRISVAGLDGADLGRIDVGFADTARGVATSGWGGRSFSLRIADAVTVLARSAAEADVAATMICNAVDLPGHVAFGRAPADSLQPESDLGVRLVTVSVGALSLGEVAEALARGAAVAEDLCGRGLAVWLRCF